MTFQDLELEKNAVFSDRVGDGSVSLRGYPAIRSKTGAWKGAVFFYALLMADLISIYGIAGNLVTYAIADLHLSIAKASSAASNFIGLAYFLSIIWGYVADAYFGRFLIILVSSVISTAGLVVLTLSVTLPSLRPPSCTPTATQLCPAASQNIQTWWYLGLNLIALGSAGLKPTMTSMGQDQFDNTDPVEKEKGTLWFPSFFAVANFAGILSATVFFYLQTDISYSLGYKVILIVCVICFITFFLGTPFYRHQKPGGSPLTRLGEVILMAFKNYKKPVPTDVKELYEADEFDVHEKPISKVVYTSRLRFFDKAALVVTDSKNKSCTVTQVEEFKAIVQILPIWATSIVVYCIFAQVLGVTIVQAGTMDRRFGAHFVLPEASSTLMLVGSALLFIPIWVYVLVPILRKFTGNPNGVTSLQQMGIALFCSIFSMFSAALVEAKRVKIISGEQVNLLVEPVPMSIFYLFPQYAILGVVEFLLGAAQFEFFYTQTPETLKSVATSLTFSSISVGYFCSTGLISTVNKYTSKHGSEGWLSPVGFNSGGLTRYYWLLCLIVGVDTVLFAIAAYFYKYKIITTEEEYSKAYGTSKKSFNDSKKSFDHSKKSFDHSKKSFDHSKKSFDQTNKNGTHETSRTSFGYTNSKGTSTKPSVDYNNSKGTTTKSSIDNNNKNGTTTKPAAYETSQTFDYSKDDSLSVTY